MEKDFDPDCPFCNFNLTGDKVAENDLAYIKLDERPITAGHSLIITKRHMADWFSTRMDEREAINDLLCARRQQLLASDPTIEGFNMGMNSGAIAGQTVFHCHFHLIPRRKSDGDSMEGRRLQGGVRGMIKAKMGSGSGLGE